MNKKRAKQLDEFAVKMCTALDGEKITPQEMNIVLGTICSFNLQMGIADDDGKYNPDAVGSLDDARHCANQIRDTALSILANRGWE